MDIDKKEFSHKAIIHGQKLGELIMCISMSRKSSVIIILYINVFGTLGKQQNFEGKLESIASEKYVDFSDSFLREGKP